MAQFKLEADFADTELAAFGIYSSLGASRFCYALNNALNLQLVRAAKDYSAKKGAQDCFFLTFGFKDPTTDLLWQLVKNKAKTEAAGELDQGGLFNAVEQSTRWLSSKTNFDYLLWIERDDALKEWPQKIADQLKEFSFIETFEILSDRLNNLVLNKTQA